MGPKPYIISHPKAGHRSKLEEDSVLRYFSHSTERELMEVRDGVTENTELITFIDRVIRYKDSVGSL